MADPIAEAFVRIRPDFTGFDTDVRKKIDSVVGGAKLSPSSQANVASQLFGTGFKKQSKTALTGMVLGTDFSNDAQRTLAQKIFGPGFRNESGRAIQGVLAGVGAGELAARFAFFGPGGAALAVLGGAFVAASVSAAKFEQSLNTLQAVAQLSDTELEKFRQTAKALGADITLPTVTAQTAADAMTELAKAGLSAADTLGAVRGVLQLSTAANVDAGTAARIAASALNAFSLAGTEAVHVADLLAGASVAAQGDIGDMALALQQSALVAKQAGLSIEQLVGLITELAQKGLVGSDAGTSIRTALLRLIPTTKEAAQLMQVLGIEIDKTRTLGQQLPELLDQYKEAFKRLAPTTRQATLQQIAGTDAIRSLTAAIDGGSAGLQRSIDAANRQGAASDLATAKTKGLAGSFQGLVSQTQTLAINMGELTDPVLEGLIRGLTDLVAAANLVPESFDGINERLDDNILGLRQFSDVISFLGEVAIEQARASSLGLGEDLRHLRTGFDNASDEAEFLRGQIERLNRELAVPSTTTERRAVIAVEIIGLEKAIGELTGARTEAEKLKAEIASLNTELIDAGPRERIAIINQIVELEHRLADLPRKAKAAAKAVLDPFKGSAFEGAFAPPIDKLLDDLSKVPDAVQREL